jgi:phosphatidylinositol glycan class F
MGKGGFGIVLIEDRDREWQKWPVTIVTGAYGGYVLGKMAGGWVFRGRKIMFD